jgi:hypothetical protein
MGEIEQERDKLRIKFSVYNKHVRWGRQGKEEEINRIRPLQELGPQR